MNKFRDVCQREIPFASELVLHYLISSNETKYKSGLTLVTFCWFKRCCVKVVIEEKWKKKLKRQCNNQSNRKVNQSNNKWNRRLNQCNNKWNRKLNQCNNKSNRKFNQCNSQWNRKFNQCNIMMEMSITAGCLFSYLSLFLITLDDSTERHCDPR